ncbi:unnamed protein product [Gordionus sp. m RMFG-2023]
MARHYNFGDPITCHAWNEQCDQIALSLNNNFVNIYAYTGRNWQLIDTLEEHELRVTAIDWCPKTNQLATCGEDRNAYVWTCFEEGWKPTLVLLRINRAAMCVKWSPNGNKFAVGSSAKLVAVCHFDEENDWWVSKHIKKSIKSTVTCIDWHPDNVLLAVGSTDFKTRIYSAILPELDKNYVPSLWGNAEKFGSLLAEFTNEYSGWVLGVSFSSTGNKLAWCSHDSTISLIDISSNPAISPFQTSSQITNYKTTSNNILNDYDTLLNNTSNLSPTQIATLSNSLITSGSGLMIVEKTPHLPFKSLQWVNENTIILAGYDCCPMIYSQQNSNKSLTFGGKLDKASYDNDKISEKLSSNVSAMSKFQSMDKHATSAKIETIVHTLHQNTINEIKLVVGGKANAEVFSTVGIDGLMVMWDVSVTIFNTLTFTNIFPRF